MPARRLRNVELLCLSGNMKTGGNSSFFNIKFNSLQSKLRFFFFFFKDEICRARSERGVSLLKRWVCFSNAEYDDSEDKRKAVCSACRIFTVVNLWIVSCNETLPGKEVTLHKKHALLEQQAGQNNKTNFFCAALARKQLLKLLPACVDLSFPGVCCISVALHIKPHYFTVARLHNTRRRFHRSLRGFSNHS